MGGPEAGKTHDIRVSARYTDGFTVACPVGTLTMSTYADFRDTLLKYAAEQTGALIVDLDRLAMPSVPALSVFPQAAIRISDWPGIPLVLACRNEDRRGMLTGNTTARSVPVHPSVALAVAAVDQPSVRSRAEIELRPSAVTTRHARYFAKLNCARWHVPGLAQDAMTIVTSFVENTLTHTSSSALLRMELRDDALMIAVTDDDPAPAVLRERVEGGVAPSGLLLVSAIAAVWGSTPTLTCGKTVWAVLRR